MTERKKYAIIVATLVIALIASFTTMLIVLVASNQSATSQVNIKYTAEDVAVKLSASATIGAVTTDFTTKEDGTGETEISLSPTNESGALYQPNSNTTSLNLTKENDEVMFKYTFTNMSGDVNVKLTMTTLPETATNLTFSYAHTRDANDDPMTLTRTEATPQNVSWLLAGYANEEPSTYVYIWAKVTDLLYGADLMGSFSWNMERTTDTEVTTYTLNTTGADLIERTTTGRAVTPSATTAYTTLAGETPTSIDVIPAKNNNAFIGWANADNPNEVIISAKENKINSFETNAIRGTISTNLVPVYKLGTVPETSFTWNDTSDSYEIYCDTIDTAATEFVIPDIYNDGTHGVAKLTAIQDGYYEFDFAGGLLMDNNTVNSIILGRFLNYIGSYSFSWLGQLTSISFPDSVTSIADNAFYYSAKLQTINWGKGLTNLSSSAFYGCSGLKRVEFSDYIESVSGDTFRGCTGIEEIVFGKSMTTIGEGVFSGCTGLTEITIPAKINNFGRNVFSGCIGLTKVYYEGTIAQWCNISFENHWATPLYAAKEKNLYIKGNLLTSLSKNDLDGVTTIKTATFAYCSNLVSVLIPESVEEVGNYAFYNCSNLVNFVLGTNLNIIGRNAFEKCTSITEITIPVNVGTIGSNAFSGCSSLAKVYLESKIWYCALDENASSWIQVNCSSNTAEQNAEYFKTTYVSQYWKLKPFN